MSRYEDAELVLLYEEYWAACRWHRGMREFALRYRQGTAALIADRIRRYGGAA